VPRYLLDVVDITRGRDGRQLVPRYLLDVVDITRGRDGRQLVPRYLLDVVDITRGRDGRQLVPQYLLDAAGDLVDIISGDHSNVSAADVVDRRTTIERAVQMIDQVMIVIFQVSASSVGRIARAL